MSVYKMSYPILYLMVICGSTTSMCLQTACSLLQLAKWSMPGKAAERARSKTRPRIGGCSAARGWVLAKLPSVHGHGQLLSTPSRIPIDTAAPVGRELFIQQAGRLATGQLMILPLQWDTLSLSIVTFDGEDRFIVSRG